MLINLQRQARGTAIENSCLLRRFGVLAVFARERSFRHNVEL